MSEENTQARQTLYRTQNDAYLGGVCGGIAKYLGIDSLLVRLIFVLSTLFVGAGVVVYIAALILVPVDPEEELMVSDSPVQMDNTSIWGMALVGIGALLLLKQLGVSRFFYFFDLPLSTIWALTLIGVGAFILYQQYDANNEAGDDAEGASSAADSSSRPFNLNVTRSRSDRKIAGICGGLAESWDIDSTIIRLGWILGTLVSSGLGVLLYLLFIFIFPEEDPSEQAI